jgi:hypothetical protein
MSGLDPDISGQTGLRAVKNRSGGKTINLGPDKLTTCKQDTIEHIKIRGTTSCNQITRNHT